MTPEARVIAKRLSQAPWYQAIAFCPHDGVRRLAAALLVGAIEDELRKVKP